MLNFHIIILMVYNSWHYLINSILLNIYLIFVLLYFSPVKLPSLFDYEGWGHLSFLCSGWFWILGEGNWHFYWQGHISSSLKVPVSVYNFFSWGNLKRKLCPIKGNWVFSDHNTWLWIIFPSNGRRWKAVSGEIDEFNKNQNVINIKNNLKSLNQGNPVENDQIWIIVFNNQILWRL